MVRTDRGEDCSSSQVPPRTHQPQVSLLSCLLVIISPGFTGSQRILKTSCKISGHPETWKYFHKVDGQLAPEGRAFSREGPLKQQDTMDAPGDGRKQLLGEDCGVWVCGDKLLLCLALQLGEGSHSSSTPDVENDPDPPPAPI